MVLYFGTMWRLMIILCSIPWSESQRGRGPRQSGHSGHGWDIRLAVPGEPGSDYPTLGAIPRTSFSCAGKTPGYYGDLETNCQVFRVCTTGSTYGFQSFLCPNGTLFNQGVHVCDWWMNVNCQASQQLFNTNNEQFGNLRLGPQLMKDIKKMLTYSMRNPYDKSIMNGNIVVMQDYRPPFGQMFPNGALIAGPERPNSIYVPAKQIQSYNQNVYGNAFAASTPSPTYVPPPVFNTISTQGDAEVFQRQRQNGAYAQNGRLQTQQIGNTISNGHAGQYTQSQNGLFSNGYSTSQPTQNNNQIQYSPKQTSFGSTQNAISTQNVQLNRQNAQYTDNRNPSQSFNGNQREYGISYTKQHFNYNPNQENQAYTNKSPLPLLNQDAEHINEAKEHLVSNNGIPATVIKKTLTFNRITQDPKPGPKSRITFKTWLVKPSKSARLIVETTPYSYNRPTQPPTARLVEAPYVYNPPTTATETERIVEEPYVYNPPTTPTQTERFVQSNDGYNYNKPTIAAKQVLTTARQPPRLYLTPTAPPPTIARLYLTPKGIPPTMASRLYIAPTTYKPNAKLYIPPSQSNALISKQYLGPNANQQPTYYKSEQLRASPTSPSPVFVSPTGENENNPSFSLTKHSRINASRNNLTFADILTKEKLDITVNDIVSDTSNVLKTATPQIEQYRQDKTADYSDEYLPSDNGDSDEKLTPQSPTVSTSARLVSGLSRDLEPPVESFDNNNNQNKNSLASLPFYKEPGTNTIERTVSLKISIPEKLASYLFKNGNESDRDKLEILNTGSSNYLVLTNNLLARNTGASIIPVGRLIADKNSNISNSQALVFSFLADSLNAAQEYSNIAQQNTISTSPVNLQAQQYQNLNNEDISQITNKISQLTASQYSVNNHNFNPANIVPTAQTTTNSDQYRASKYTNSLQNQPQQNHRAQISSATQTTQGYSARLQNGVNANLQTGNQIYSGQLYQLPVPDVTSQIYNAGANNNMNQQQIQNHRMSQVNVNNNNLGKQSSEVEIVQSEVMPLPAKLRFAPNVEFSSQEHSAQAQNFLNNNNGISAQINDKIVGTIPHPSENKLVTYKKDQSYFVYTKLENGIGNVQSKSQSNNLHNANLVQQPQNVVSFQFIPSVSYQLDDEKEQQKILNAFQLDEYGNPKKINGIQTQDISSNVNYSVEHPTSGKLVDGRFNDVNNLYTGPSSYSAPQASVGSLDVRERNQNSNSNARLEQFDESNNGYVKTTPARQFSF